MTAKIIPSHINFNFVVLEEDGKATPIAVSNRFYADLEQQFGDFKGSSAMVTRLNSQFCASLKADLCF
jgi:hypothetical protein